MRSRGPIGCWCRSWGGGSRGSGSRSGRLRLSWGGRRCRCRRWGSWACKSCVSICRYTNRSLLSNTLQVGEGLGNWVNIPICRFGLACLSGVRGCNVKHVVSNVQLEICSGINRLRAGSPMLWTQVRLSSQESSCLFRWCSPCSAIMCWCRSNRLCPTILFMFALSAEWTVAEETTSFFLDLFC